MMIPKYWLVCGCLSAGMVVLATPAIASPANECIAGQPTAESYTHDFRQEADTTFQDLRSDAEQISQHAAFLQRATDDLDLTWESHGTELNQLRDSVNDMAERLCRLEAIRRVVAPWQQQVIDEVATKVPLLVNSTEDAILFLNSNQQDLWNPTYQKYVNNIHQDAVALNHSLNEAVRYNRVS